MRIFPIKTFPKRLTWKLNLVVRKIKYHGPRMLRLKGAQVATNQEINDQGGTLDWVKKEREEKGGGGLCTVFDLTKMEKTTLINLASAEFEGATEEVQRRGLAHLLPKVAE